MDRRALLCLLAVGGTASLSGCFGGDDATTSGYEDLTVDDFDVVEGDDGTLVVTVTVANTAAESRSGTLYVNVEANGTANTRVRHAEVGPAGTQDFEVPFDVTMTAFNDGGSLDFDFAEA